MMETINKTTVCTYYAAATLYCEETLQTKCVEWLERRLTSETSVTLLKDIRWVQTIVQPTYSGLLNLIHILARAYNSTLLVTVERAVLNIFKKTTNFKLLSQRPPWGQRTVDIVVR